MCGRYTITSSEEAISEAFAVEGWPWRGMPARYNLAPTQGAPVVRLARRAGDRELAVLRWGLVPPWAKDMAIGIRLINARSETAAEKPAFRDAFRHRRCIVPADGFFEWQTRGGKGSKQPFLIQPAQGGLFGFAGLWSDWRDPAGVVVESFTILTCAANDRLSSIHHRMPVILRSDDYGAWLAEQGDPARLLRPAPDETVDAVAITTRVNAVANDDPGVLAPAASGAGPAPGGQMSLFAPV